MIGTHLRLGVITALSVTVALYVASLFTRKEVVEAGMQATYVLWDVILVVAIVTVTVMLSRLIPKKEY